MNIKYFFTLIWIFFFKYDIKCTVIFSCFTFKIFFCFYHFLQKKNILVNIHKFLYFNIVGYDRNNKFHYSGKFFFLLLKMFLDRTHNFLVLNMDSAVDFCCFLWSFSQFSFTWPKFLQKSHIRLCFLFVTAEHSLASNRIQESKVLFHAHVL